MPATIDIEDLGLDSGAHLLIKRGLAAIPVGDEILVTGRAPGLVAQVGAWCREQGHGASVIEDSGREVIRIRPSAAGVAQR